jgi:uncharacterized protein (TIGR02118 family)
MYKMTILFKKATAERAALIEHRWATEFLPLAEQMPGVVRLSLARVFGEPSGASSYDRLHEFYFATDADLDAALSSPVGIKAGQVLLQFAADLVTVLFSEVFEENVPSMDASLHA